MDLFISRMVGYVNSAAQGDPIKLISSGFNLAKQPEKLHALDAPVVLKSSTGRLPGEALVRWAGVKGALMYELEMGIGAADEEQEWRRIKLTSKPEFLVSGLEPNSTHPFRVRAIGTPAEGPFSYILHVKTAA